MKKLVLFLTVAVVAVSLGLTGCTQKAANSKEAIQQAEELSSVDAKVDYLVKQANAFISSNEFDEAIKASKYILSNLDKDSDKARQLIETAKAEMKKAASKAMDDAKSKLGGIGN